MGVSSHWFVPPWSGYFFFYFFNTVPSLDSVIERESSARAHIPRSILQELWRVTGKALAVMPRKRKQASHLGELTSTEQALGKLRSLHRAQFLNSWAPWFSETLATTCWEDKHMQQTHPYFPRTAFWGNPWKRWRCNWGRINPEKDLEAKEEHHFDHKFCQQHKTWRHPACLQC